MYYRGSSNSAVSNSADKRFGPKGARIYSIISAIPRYSAIFGSHASIDSNSAVSDSAQNFWDKFPRYSRTPYPDVLKLEKIIAVKQNL